MANYSKLKIEERMTSIICNNRDGLIEDPIIDKINKILEKIGKDEEYDLIMDARMGGVVYAKEKFDLTDRVVKILNKE